MTELLFSLVLDIFYFAIFFRVSAMFDLSKELIYHGNQQNPASIGLNFLNHLSINLSRLEVLTRRKVDLRNLTRFETNFGVKDFVDNFINICDTVWHQEIVMPEAISKKFLMMCKGQKQYFKEVHSYGTKIWFKRMQCIVSNFANGNNLETIILLS